MNLEDRVTRRSFVNYVLGGGVVAWLGAILYPVLLYFRPPAVPEANVSSVKVTKLSQLPPNTAVSFQFGRKPGLLLRTRSGDLRAFNATCTHLACTVQYVPSKEAIWCACHNGTYDLNGINIAGPPPRPLEPFEVNVRGDDLFVSRKG